MRPVKNHVILQVVVRPNSKREGIEEKNGILYVRVKERAERGKANERLIEVLAEHFGVPKGRVRIIRGAKSRKKVVLIEEV